MTFNEGVRDVVEIVEATGAAIMVLGGLWVLCAYVIAASRRDTRAYRTLRRNLGKVILVGLEVLIIGDIIQTIIVDPTIESVAVLGLIVVIRIVLSISLELEVEGTWPWKLRQLEQTSEGSDRTTQTNIPSGQTKIPSGQT